MAALRNSTYTSARSPLDARCAEFAALDTHGVHSCPEGERKTDIIGEGCQDQRERLTRPATQKQSISTCICWFVGLFLRVPNRRYSLDCTIHVVCHPVHECLQHTS